MSLGRSESSLNEKFDLPTGVVPRNFLRRQREEDAPSRSSSRRPVRRKKSYGGPVSRSAIAPIRNGETTELSANRSDSDTLAVRSEESPDQVGDNPRTSSPATPLEHPDGDGEVFEEGDQTVYEDENGNVLQVENEDSALTDAERHEHERREAERLNTHENSNMPREPEKAAQTSDHGKGESERGGWLKNLQKAREHRKRQNSSSEEKGKAPTRGPARAYQYGNTIIVEDEDGEVIKKYDINPPEKKEGQAVSFADPKKTRERMHRMGSYLGVRPKEPVDEKAGKAANPDKKKKGKDEDDDDDDRIRFVVEAGGERMSKAEFIRKIREMDPKSRARLVEQSNVPEAVKQEAREDAQEHTDRKRQGQPSVTVQPPSPYAGDTNVDYETAEVRKIPSHESANRGPEGLTLMDSNEQDIPFHDVTGELHRLAMQRDETAAQRRRREAHERARRQAEDSDDDGTERVPPLVSLGRAKATDDTEEETAAERRRREGALGIHHQDSESDEEMPAPPPASRMSVKFAGAGETAAERRRRAAAMTAPNAGIESGEGADEAQASRPGIRFADHPAPQRGGQNGPRR